MNAMVAVPHISGREWTRLTLGFVWRLALLSIPVSLVGSLAAFAVAFVVPDSLRPPATTNDAVALSLMLAAGMVMFLLAAHVFVRWVLTASYGGLRLAVVRDSRPQSPE